MRKRINALRRRYQRTTNNDELRERRKNQYHDEKTEYQTAIKREKSHPGKNSVTLHHLQTHGMRSTNLPRTKQKEANPCPHYRNQTDH